MSLGNAFKTVKGKVVTAGLAATMSLAASGAALANDDNLQQTSSSHRSFAVRAI